MKIKMVAIICISIIFLSCKKDEDNKSQYLDQWVGIYEGTSYHWETYPIDTVMVTKEQRKKVTVEVQKSEVKSSLDFKLTFEDGKVDTKNELKFSTSGMHSSHWGGGSGYGSLNIVLKSDSLNYDYYQSCGMVCDSGIDFKIKKK